jgi:hypothetical protein
MRLNDGELFLHFWPGALRGEILQYLVMSLKPCSFCYVEMSLIEGIYRLVLIVSMLDTSHYGIT